MHYFKNKQILFLTIIYVILGLSLNLVHPITPTFFKSLNMSSLIFGIAYATMSFSSFIFSPFYGNLAKYIQPKKLFFISCFGYSVGQIIFALSKNVPMVLIGRAISGSSIAASSVSVLYIVSKIISDKERKKVLPVITSLYGVFGAFGHTFGGFLGDINIFLPFLTQVIICLTCAISFYFIIKNIEVEPINKNELIKNCNPIKIFFEIKNYTHRKLNFHFITIFLLSFAHINIWQMFSYYLINFYNLNNSLNGTIRAIIGISSLILNYILTTKIISSKNVEMKNGIIILISFISLLNIIIFRNIYTFIFLGIFILSLDSVISSITQDRSIDYCEVKGRSVVIGFHNSVKSLGAVIGSLFSGYFYAINPIMPFVVASVFYLVAYLFNNKVIKSV